MWKIYCYLILEKMCNVDFSSSLNIFIDFLQNWKVISYLTTLLFPNLSAKALDILISRVPDSLAKLYSLFQFGANGSLYQEQFWLIEQQRGFL